MSSAVFVVVALLLSGKASAQEPLEVPATPAPAPPAPPPWWERIKVEGMVDAYYSYRLQGAPSMKVNELRAFDSYNHTFSVGYAKVAVSMPAEPVGFRADLGFGPTADIAASDIGSAGFEAIKHVQQAYASVKLGKLVAIDFGKFNTSAGAEVIEANANWLQSRSMIFAYGPYTHTGLRVSVPLGELLTLQGGIVNGWDSVFASSSWKTFNLSAALNVASTGTTAYLNLYAGPQAMPQPGLESGSRTAPDVRTLVDVVVNQTLGERVALNLNAIVGNEGAKVWYAGALTGKVQVTEMIRVSARLEYFADPDGHRMGTAGASYLGATLGAAFAFSGLGNYELRPELRHDQAIGDAAYTPYAAGTSAAQTTLSVAAVAWF